MSGVICGKRVPARVKVKLYMVTVQPAISYGIETVALTKRKEAEMEVVELKMLRFSLGVTRMDKITNEYILETAQVRWFGEKTREARRWWFGYIQRKASMMMGMLVELRRMMRMELPGKRKQGRRKRRFMDSVREDMAVAQVTEEDAEIRPNGGGISAVATPAGRSRNNTYTVEPLTNDHPHQRPSLSYDHISCDGQWFLFVYESLTSDHPSYTTTPM